MLTSARTSIIVFVLLQGLATTGCGQRSAPAAPTRVTGPSAITTASATATPAPAPAPAGFGAIVGYVVDTAFRPLPGARVEILGGADAGQSTTADAEGHFSLVASFDATTPFRATIEGHVVATDVPHSSGGQRWIVFYLEPLAPPVNIAGDYTLTLVADAACGDLPDEIRTRSYTATIAEAPTPHVPANYFSVTVHGTAPAIVQSFSAIGVAGHDLGFDLSRNHNDVPTLVEQVAPDAYVSYMPNDGFAGTSVETAASAISTSFDGVISYSSPGAHAQCASAHHRVNLTRR